MKYYRAFCNTPFGIKSLLQHSLWKIQFAILFFASHLVAQEISPWLGRVYELEFHAKNETVQAKSIDTSHGTRSKTFRGNLTLLGLSATLSEVTSASLHISGAKLRGKSFGADTMCATYRYLFANDLRGDPLSIATGCTLSYAFHDVLHEPLLVRHGPLGAKVYLSVGKEFNPAKKVFVRPSLAMSYGIAQKSSSWAEAEARLNTSIFDQHDIDLFARYEHGFGHKKLHSTHHFAGYGHIQYRLVDAGILLKQHFHEYGSAYAQVTRRFFSRYTVSNYWGFEIGIIFPFSVL
jgi:hypothetical protein